MVEQCNTVEGHTLCEYCYGDIAGRECDYRGPGYVICSPKIKAHEHAVKKTRKCELCEQDTDDDILILHKSGVECWSGDPLEQL